MSNATSLSGSLPGTMRLAITPTATQLFMFSAITWNRHQIHFNLNQAKEEGFPAVAVQRGLLGNFLARLVTEWGSDLATLERLQWKVQQSAFPNQQLECIGEVKGPASEAGLTAIELKILNPDSAVVATGEAWVRLKK